jgi:hypothetical protein
MSQEPMHKTLRSGMPDSIIFFITCLDGIIFEFRWSYTCNNSDPKKCLMNKMMESAILDLHVMKWPHHPAHYDPARFAETGSSGTLPQHNGQGCLTTLFHCTWRIQIPENDFHLGELFQKAKAPHKMYSTVGDNNHILYFLGMLECFLRY